MDDTIKRYFLKALELSKTVEKEDILRFGEEKGIEFPKRISRKNVISKIIQEGYFSELYEAFQEFTAIPVWEVADFFMLNSKQIDKLADIKIIQEEPVLSEFYSPKEKSYYTANMYNISVLQNYTAEELKTAYNEAYYQESFRTRIEGDTEEEIQELIDELSLNYIIEKVTFYPRRNNGYHAYFTIKKMNNSKNEANAMLVKIQKLEDELNDYNRYHLEEMKRMEKKVFDMFQVKTLTELKAKAYRIRGESQKKHQNERGAGRKSKFQEAEKEAIRMYRLQGKTIKEIAKLYDCSVGLIHKIIKNG